MSGTGYEKQSGRLTWTQKLGERLRGRRHANSSTRWRQRGLTNNDNAGVSYYMALPVHAQLLRPAAGARTAPTPTNPFIGSTTNPLQTAALSTERRGRLAGHRLGQRQPRRLYKDETSELLMLLGNFGVDRSSSRTTCSSRPS